MDLYWKKKQKKGVLYAYWKLFAGMYKEGRRMYSKNFSFFFLNTLFYVPIQVEVLLLVYDGP